ncbi:unnamed protein product [Amoebophrya sp. A25]|nr:unnamed protein product [Amoebophrya sp. A25]|eukprot:GSA25T00001037001.1
MIHRTDSFVVRFTCYTFPLVASLTGVPLCSIVCRYNLLEQGLCNSPWVANFWSILIPWLVSIPLQTMSHGEGTQSFLTCGSLVFGTFVNFVIPFFTFLKYNELFLTNGEIGYTEASHLLEDRSRKAHWGVSHRLISRQRMQQLAHGCLLFTTCSFLISIATIAVDGVSD